jgi:hypothetical protein
MKFFFVARRRGLGLRPLPREQRLCFAFIVVMTGVIYCS